MENKKLISVVTPCYNEEENIEDVYREIKRVFSDLPKYRYEHIFIDNHSTDKTIAYLREIASRDKNVKVIINIKNFGHLRSPYYAKLQAKGDAVVLYFCDLQDPTDMIKGFIGKWEEGFEVVLGVKNKSKENPLMFLVRKIFYSFMTRIAETQQIKNFTGFGLYDQSFISLLRTLDTPYPYFRGLVAEFGTNRIEIPFTQQKRKKGKTKNNFYTLYDLAVLGITSYSKLPLRIAAFMGFVCAFLSFLIAVGYAVYKLLFWQRFELGMAPVVIGMFFLGSIQLFFIGVIGEYVGNIFTQVKKMPLVVEKERINFD